MGEKKKGYEAFFFFFLLSAFAEEERGLSQDLHTADMVSPTPRVKAGGWCSWCELQRAAVCLLLKFQMH